MRRGAHSLCVRLRVVCVFIHHHDHGDDIEHLDRFHDDGDEHDEHDLSDMLGTPRSLRRLLLQRGVRRASAR